MYHPFMVYRLTGLTIRTSLVIPITNHFSFKHYILHFEAAAMTFFIIATNTKLSYVNLLLIPEI